MPTIPGRDQHGIHVFGIQQLPEIRERAAVLVLVVGIDQLLGRFQAIRPAIAHRHKLDIRLSQEVRQDGARAIADAKATKPNAAVRRLSPIQSQDRSRHDEWDGRQGRGAFQELAASNLITGVRT